MRPIPRRYGRRYDRDIADLDLDGLTNPPADGFLRVGCPVCAARPGDRCIMGGKTGSVGAFCHKLRAARARAWIALCGALPW